MPDLQSLIERVEKASGPDRDLNRAVARHFGWHRVEPRFARSKHGGWIAPEDFIGTHSDGSPICDSLHGTDIHRDVPDFTASLDAVMALMPDGLEYNITNIYGIAHVDIGINVDDQHSSRREDGNITLALLSAILKSRLATNGGGDSHE